MQRRYLLPTLLLLAASLQAAPLDPLLKRTDLWQLTADTFPQQPEARPYGWSSAAHDSARAADRKDLTLFNLPIVESVARFESGKLTQVTAVVYARGDAGDLEEDPFKKLVQNTITAVNTATGVTFSPRGREASNAVHAEGVVWQTPAAQYLLEYSFTKEVKSRNIPFRAEFVRLTVTPPQQAKSLLASVSQPAATKFNGPSHVKKDLTSGDVVIPDVPMVDQGQKGYCAVACTERMMRYYGVAADENEIAQAANTNTAGGTSADAMFEALKKLGARLHVKVRPVQQLDVKELLTLIRDYNRTAKKDGATPLPDPGHMIDVDGMFLAMKADVLEETRTKNKSDVTRFEHAVQDHINQGIPLVWSVMLGLFPEKGDPQGSGGHMRLIIGYNDKTQEILYTDSWGRGHELKRMPVGHAIAINMGLNTIEPL